MGDTVYSKTKGIDSGISWDSSGDARLILNQRIRNFLYLLRISWMSGWNPWKPSSVRGKTPSRAFLCSSSDLLWIETDQGYPETRYRHVSGLRRLLTTSLDWRNFFHRVPLYVILSIMLLWKLSRVRLTEITKWLAI